MLLFYHDSQSETSWIFTRFSFSETSKSWVKSSRFSAKIFQKLKYASLWVWILFNKLGVGLLTESQKRVAWHFKFFYCLGWPIKPIEHKRFINTSIHRKPQSRGKYSWIPPTICSVEIKIVLQQTPSCSIVFENGVFECFLCHNHSLNNISILCIYTGIEEWFIELAPPIPLMQISWL